MKLVLFLAFSAMAATAASITSLSYGNGGCVTTLADGCAPIGLTLSGATNNAFLNNVNTKAINLAVGSYYTFNEPFFSTGGPLTITLTLSDSTSRSATITLPNLSAAGNTLAHFTGAEDILITTTGITNADRVSFGFAPAAFNPSGTNDTVFQLVFTEPSSAVPEPGTFFMPVAAASLWWIRRKLAARSVSRQ
jgi:hypothetical protein